MGIRIDALDAGLATRDHEIPAMKDNLTVKLTVGDVLDLLVGAAPGQLDTLEELAAALADDENFAATITAALALKSDAADTDTHDLTAKTTPVDADEIRISDSAASWVFKKLTFANLKAWVRSFLYLTQRYESGELTVTSGGTHTLTTGFSSPVKVISLRLKFVGVEDGYVIGDEIFVHVGQSATSRGVSVKKSGNDLVIRYGSEATVFQYPVAASGTSSSIDNANVRLIVEAFA